MQLIRAYHWDPVTERRLRARRVVGMNGSAKIASGDLVRFEDSEHPLGRAMHDAGPGEVLEIVGVNIATLEALEDERASWSVYRVGAG